MLSARFWVVLGGGVCWVGFRSSEKDLHWSKVTISAVFGLKPVFFCSLKTRVCRNTLDK